MLNFKRQHKTDNVARMIAALAIVITICGGVVRISVAYYDAETESISCCGRTITLQAWVDDPPDDVDYDQDAAVQATDWVSFRDTYGLTDADRDLSDYNRTMTYNCHSYCYNGSDRWLDPGEGALEEFFHDTASGCWSQDPNGTVLSLRTGDNNHSCEVADYKGKCGPQFL